MTFRGEVSIGTLVVEIIPEGTFACLGRYATFVDISFYAFGLLASFIYSRWARRDGFVRDHIGRGKRGESCQQDKEYKMQQREMLMIMKRHEGGRLSRKRRCEIEQGSRSKGRRNASDVEKGRAIKPSSLTTRI